MKYDMSRASRFYEQCLPDVMEKLYGEPGDESDSHISPADILETTLVRWNMSSGIRIQIPLTSFICGTTWVLTSSMSSLSCSNYGDISKSGMCAYHHFWRSPLDQLGDSRHLCFL